MATGEHQQSQQEAIAANRAFGRRPGIGRKRWTTKRQDRAMHLLDRILWIIYEAEDGNVPAEHDGLRGRVAQLRTAIVDVVTRESDLRRERKIQGLIARGR